MCVCGGGGGDRGVGPTELTSLGEGDVGPTELTSLGDRCWSYGTY